MAASAGMGFGKIFQGGKKWIFQIMAKSIFPDGANSGETSFYQLETKRKTFYSKTFLEKYQNFNIQ